MRDLAVHVERSARSRWRDLGVHVPAILVFTLERCGHPKEPELTEALLRGLEGTLALLREVPGLPEAVLQPLSLALQEARDTRQEELLEQIAYEHLGNMGKLARGALAAKLDQEQAALGLVRERLAAEVLLLGDVDLKKLERHRKLLESSMQTPAKSSRPPGSSRSVAASRTATGVSGT
jgi:hypothetical protein